jgi:signal transduction histidine kinase
MKLRFLERLSTRLAIVPLLAALLVFSISGYALYYLLFIDFQKSFIHARLIDITENKRLQTEDWLMHIKYNLAAASSSVSLQNALLTLRQTSGGPETVEPEGKTARLTMKENKRLEALQKERQDALNSLVPFMAEWARFGNYREFNVLSVQGDILAGSGPTTGTPALTGADLSLSADSGQKGPVLLRLRRVGESGTAVDFLAPVTGEDNTTAAFLFASVDAGKVAEYLRIRRGIFATEKIVMIDGEGNLMLTKDGPPLKQLRYNLPAIGRENPVGDRDGFFFYQIPVTGSPFKLLGIVAKGEARRPMFIVFGVFLACALFVLLVMAFQWTKFFKLVMYPLSRLHAVLKAASMGNFEMAMGDGYSGEILELKTAVDAVITELNAKDLLLRKGITVRDKIEGVSTVLSRMSGERIKRELLRPLEEVVEGMRVALSGGDALEIEKVSGTAFTLLGFVDDLIVLAGLEEGSTGMVHEEFSFNEVMEEAGDRTRKMTGMKEIELIVDCADELKEKTVYTDRRILSRILNSLASTAVKCTEVGTITITASLETRNGVEFMVISVADTGTGFPKVTLEAILNESTCPIGMLQYATAKGLTFFLGGEIEAESMEDKGSVFTVTIPLRSAVN